MDLVKQSIEPVLKFFVAYVIPIASFFISIVALYKTRNSAKVDDRLKALELKIKENQVKELELKENKESSPYIEARIVQISKSNYKVKVWNSGDERAYKVNVIIPDQFNLIIMDDKLPYEYLDPGDSFEENVIVHMGSSRKFDIITQWETKDGKIEENKKLRSI